MKNDFWRRKLSLPPFHCTSQNSIISFGYVDYQAKIFLILHPPLENSTTRITIVCNLKINIKNHQNLHWPQCLLLHEDCHNIFWLVPKDLWLAFFWWFLCLQLWYIVPIFSDCLQPLQWNHYRAAYQSIFASANSRQNQ